MSIPNSAETPKRILRPSGTPLRAHETPLRTPEVPLRPPVTPYGPLSGGLVPCLLRTSYNFPVAHLKACEAFRIASGIASKTL